MNRILVVDDVGSQKLTDSIQDEVEGASGDLDTIVEQIDPTNAINSHDQEAGIEDFLDQVSERAADFWDVVAIDYTLGEVRRPLEEGMIHLPILIAERFRRSNRAATIMLYSGTLQQYVGAIVAKAGRQDNVLRRIFMAEIANFFPRDRVPAEVASAIQHPSWLLRLDRFLMRHGSLNISPRESEFCGRGFADLAKSVRQQDTSGQRIAQLVAEHGIACLVDLNDS